MTARSKGLELMICHDLAAFVSTNEVDATKVGWGGMPFTGIIADLGTRTRGRYVHADDPRLKSPTVDFRFTTTTGSLRKTTHDAPSGRGSWVQCQSSWFEIGCRGPREACRRKPIRTRPPL